MEFLKQNAGVLGLFVGGLAGAILTAIVNYVRRDKVILGRKVTRRTIITEKGPDFIINFKGQIVQRLDQQEIVLKNIGNKVIENISVTIEVTGNILEKKLEKPDGSTFVLEPNPENEKQLRLECDYINKDDVITVQITEADSRKEEAKVVARAKNLEVKRLDTGIVSYKQTMIFQILVMMMTIGFGLLSISVAPDFMIFLMVFYLIAIIFSLLFTFTLLRKINNTNE